MIFLTTFAISFSCYVGMLYLTSEDYSRDVIVTIFMIGFVCLWIELGATVLILIQRNRSEDQVTILKLEKEVAKHKQEVEELKKIR